MMDWGAAAWPWLGGAVVRGLAVFGLIAAVVWLVDRNAAGQEPRLDPAAQSAPPPAPATRSAPPPVPASPPIDPELILAQRFAAGEIDPDEFAQRRSLLRQ